MELKFTGSCLCGEIKFAVAEFIPAVANCHCSMCRKHTGAAFATYASVESEKFQWLAGSQFLKRFTAANGTTRTFCSECGSSLLFSSPRAPSNVIEVSLASLDDDSPIKPNAHIFVGYKANWSELDGDLPSYDEGRGSAG